MLVLRFERDIFIIYVELWIPSMYLALPANMT